MDTIVSYRNIIKKIILSYAQLRPSHGDIRLDPVFDEANDRYALMQVGWDKQRRVRGNLIYITIQAVGVASPVEHRVFVEYDGTETGVTDELVEAGIPRDNIILAFHQLV
jgi:XisI protein